MKLISSGGGSRAANGRSSSRTYSSAAPRKRFSDTQDLPKIDQQTQPAPNASAKRYSDGAFSEASPSASAPRTSPARQPSQAAKTAPVRNAESAPQTGYSPAYPRTTSVSGVRIVHDAQGAGQYERQAPIREEKESAAPYETVDIKKNRSSKNRTGRLKRCLIGWGIALVSLAALYLFCVYTSIPFIANLRSIYIETAMTTMEHQWLATAFIPLPVVQETMGRLDELERKQEDMESDWSQYSSNSASVLPAFKKEDEDPVPGSEDENPGEVVDDPVVVPEFWEDPTHEFWQIYNEIDYDSFYEYALEHQDTMYNENGYLFIDEADASSNGTGILTTNGDPVLGIDTENGIIMVRLDGMEYRGVMAIVKDPKQISIGIAQNLGSYGSKIATIAERYDSILAINASGFEDDGGVGNGGTVYGLLYVEGEKIKGSAGGTYKAIYFDSEYRLNVRSYTSGLDIYNGVEFKPALVINGEAAVSGSAGWGIQPRAAIGQREDGSVIMIIIDGRQTHSVGITVGDLADLFIDYGAVQAGNLDGGSSAVMYYNGRIITKPSGADKVNGRSLPNAFIVKPRSAISQ